MLPGWVWVDVLGATTVVLALMFALPQLMRLMRTGSAAGLSLTSLGNSAVGVVAWLGYALHVGDVWVLTSTLVYSPMLAVTAWLAWRAGADRSAPWLPVLYAGILAGALVLDLSTGAQVFALVLGCSTLWTVGPALYSVWTTHDVSGVAPVTWWVLMVEGMVFLAYGATAGRTATLVYAVVCLIGSTGVLSRLAVDHFELDVTIPVKDRSALDLAA